MGMVIFFLLFLYVIAAVAVITLVRRFITTNRWVSAILITIAILLPTYDIIITNVLGAYYCYSEPNPKTLIKKKVEYPLSIYWEDNVYPGFNAEDRKLMIINYLDGKHLQKMALNGDDGKIYVYEAKEGDFKSIRYDKKHINIYEQYAQYIIEKSEKVYTKETMPKINYSVTFDEIKLNPLSRKFLYSDETKIIDNNTNETIAYNRRYMRFFYNIAPDFSLGNRYYVSEPMCGNQFNKDFESDIFLKLKYMYGGEVTNKVTLNKKLYNKHIQGEK